MADEKKISPFTRSKITGKKILSKGKKKAQAFLSKLSDDDKLHVLLTSEPKFRVPILSLISNRKHIIQTLPEEEFYWTIKEIGIKKSLPLLALCSPDQTHFIFDIEWWNGDTLNIKKVYQWFKILLKCGEEKIAKWFQTSDLDLIILSLKQFIRVYKPYEGTDDYGESIEGLPSFTFDGIYFIEFIKKGTEDVIKKFLSVLLSTDNQLFNSIMEMIIWGIDAELEEDSFINAQERLGEKGIPDLEDALNIYRRILPEEIAEIPKKDFSEKKNGKIQKSFYPIRLGGTKDLFITKILNRIEDFATLEDLSLNLARVTNKVIVADRFTLSNHTSFKEKIAKATGIINIGLETISNEDETKGIDEINSRWMEQLFSIGWNSILNLRKNSFPVIESLNRNFSLGLEILDFPLRETLKGIQKTKPLFFAGKTEDDCNNYRDFRSVAEISLTQDRINQAFFLTNLITNGFGISILKSDNDIRWYDYENKLSLCSIFMTSYANKITKNNWDLQYIDLQSLQIFLDHLFNGDKNFNQNKLDSLLCEIKDEIEILFHTTLSDKELSHLNTFFCECLEKLRNEYKEATEDGFLDVIAFKTLLIQHLDIG